MQRGCRCVSELVESVGLDSAPEWAAELRLQTYFASRSRSGPYVELCAAACMGSPIDSST